MLFPVNLYYINETTKLLDKCEMYEWEIKGIYSKNIHRITPKIFNLHIWVKQPQLIASSSNRMVVILFSKISY